MGPRLSRASHVTLSEECPVEERGFIKKQKSKAKSKRSSQALPGAQPVLGESCLPPPWAGPPSASSQAGPPSASMLSGPLSASALGWAQLWGQRGTTEPGKQGVTHGAAPFRGPAGCRGVEEPPPQVRGAAESGLGVQAGAARGSPGPPCSSGPRGPSRFLRGRIWIRPRRPHSQEEQKYKTN